jgi:hypothetical protein
MSLPTSCSSAASAGYRRHSSYPLSNANAWCRGCSATHPVPRSPHNTPHQRDPTTHGLCNPAPPSDMGIRITAVMQNQNRPALARVEINNCRGWRMNRKLPHVNLRSNRSPSSKSHEPQEFARFGPSRTLPRRPTDSCDSLCTGSDAGNRSRSLVPVTISERYLVFHR